MDNERDAEGHMICPVCSKVIRSPLESPIMGTKRVHKECWSSPFRPRGVDPHSN